MASNNQKISKAPLWDVPEPIRDRLKERHKDQEYSHFLLCGLYSAVALTFLLLFGFAAWTRGDTGFSIVIFCFAGATSMVYGSAWYTQHYRYTKHFLTILMGGLCLYLFYSGGTSNSGPLYYFVFPLVAVFLQSFRNGIISVVTLIVLTLFLEMGAMGFDTDRYPSIFVVRVFAIYTIISMLAFLFEYFRVKAERELLLSVDDLNQLIYGDLTTNLANRRLMEKLLVSEFNRSQRYGMECCVLLIEPDISLQYASLQQYEIRVLLSKVLRKHLRLQDIAGVWDETRFMLLLPETSQKGAAALAERLLVESKEKSFVVLGKGDTKFSISIGLAKLSGHSADELVVKVTELLIKARRDGGDRIIQTAIEDAAA